MTALPVLLAAAVLAVGQPGPKLSPEAHNALSAPPPANLQREVVLAWMAKYVRAGGDWTLLAYDYEGVKLAAAGGVTRTPEGLAEAEVRTELFRPIEVRAGVARSGLAHWSVDCMAGRLAVLKMTIYAANNLQGELATKVSDGPDWQDPVGSEGDAIRAVCKAIGR
ncbi:MAG: hypothetical protein JWP49_2401 [Phenylobacterium sp.]|nr:hypothetical protein [Phenylobacterium sp.]